MPKRGLQDLARDLKRLEAKVAKKIVKQAQKMALRPLAAAIKRDSPVESGEMKGGIKVKAGKRKKNHIITLVVIPTPEENPHAGRVEFGTRETPAKPFIRPNAKSMTPGIVATLADEIEAGLKKL